MVENRPFERPSWAINGRFVTQRMTGVQRYAHEIVAALDDLLVENRDAAARLALRLVLPPAAQAVPALANIEICRTSFGSGHAWDQFTTRQRSFCRKPIRARLVSPIARCCP
jgi:hypothetical protein